MKDPQVEKPKLKSQKQKAQALQRSESTKIPEKAWKEKKNYCQHCWGHQAPRDKRLKEASIPATRVNNTSTAKGGNLRKN